jgi:hypothetical protein
MASDKALELAEETMGRKKKEYARLHEEQVIASTTAPLILCSVKMKKASGTSIILRQ